MFIIICVFKDKKVKHKEEARKVDQVLESLECQAIEPGF